LLPFSSCERDDHLHRENRQAFDDLAPGLHARGGFRDCREAVENFSI
jgi:hypothetical protein